jgi:hypothetical protein
MEKYTWMVNVFVAQSPFTRPTNIILMPAIAECVGAGVAGQPWGRLWNIGQGAQEIRVRTNDGAYRIFYVAKFENVINKCCNIGRNHYHESNNSPNHPRFR